MKGADGVVGLGVGVTGRRDRWSWVSKFNRHLSLTT